MSDQWAARIERLRNISRARPVNPRQVSAQAPKITCPSYVTDNETDPVSTGQGEELFNALTCPKEFRRFLQKEGAEGHCEGMAPVVFWTAAFDWLESTLP